ncbi:flagellin [Roseovarius sp. SCSIO 43702]|uniref:flagellin n=1 Tax=Roseovarius sp. SCSIO 43702 TaxID=2823043 RepID=UPI001C732F12|nr:flagellin [Roseovarius sp. SCSIO 43702]QYX57105.1 flagellin [Roseovarius sp. SCSIO 43702]
MSSILTNNSAMVALQTLKSVNKNLATTQNEISTGKSVSSAKDNSAVWAISKVMEADVSGFKAISDSLALGESTVAVARNASETVTDLLINMRDKIVGAQGDNVDREKLNDEIQAYIGQIKSVVGAAQFNGLNLVDGSQSDLNTDGNTGVDILSSLDRGAGGSISVSNIGVAAQNLSTTAGTDLTAVDADVSTLAASGGADMVTVTLGAEFLENDGNAGGAVALKAGTAGVDLGSTAGLVEGDVVRLKVGDVEGSYVVRAGDTNDSVFAGVKNGLLQAGLDDSKFAVVINAGTSITVENLTNQGNIGVSLTQQRGSGALTQLETMNVSTESGANTALSQIEGMIQSSIDASASFGSVETRIGTQSDFVSKLTDSLKSGIGAMVDADMEETSARLQALQVQQQLAVQSLSIANQAPQSILSLFR